MNDPYTRKLQVMLNSARYLLAICVNILVLVLILYGVSRVCICGYHFCYAVFGTVTVDQGKGQEKVFQDIFKVKAVDTTAAGDTFAGYFIAALIERRGIQEALRMAAKASSIAVSRPGATPSIPSADEVKKELGML